MAAREDNVTELKGKGTEVPPKDPPPQVTGTGQGVMFGEYGPLDTPEVRQAVKDTYERIAKKIAKRDQINAQIKAEREGLVNRGLNRDAIKDGVRRAAMAPNKRLDYDRSYMIARAAMDAPVVIHPDPVEDDDEPGDDDGAEPPTH